MKPNRAYLSCLAWFLALGQACGASAAAAEQRWHCDIPSLAPDGVRVAYLQWDSALVRIVVVNLDQPDRTMYFNLGENWTDPICIVWTSAQHIELRRGDSTFARFTVDPADVSSAKPPGSHRNALLWPADLADVHERLQRQLPHRSIRILNGDDIGRRILLLADTATDPGRYFVYDRTIDLLFEVARRKTPPSTP